MKQYFEPLFPICDICEAHCVINIELMEYIIERYSDMDDYSDIDALVDKALRGEHIDNMEPPTAPFPLGVDKEHRILMMLAWCPACKQPVVCVISIDKLLKICGG